MERKGKSMFFKGIANKEESKSYYCFNPCLYGYYYNSIATEELLFNHEELQSMLDLNALAGAKDHYNDIFYAICKIAFKNKKMTFKKIMNGMWKEVEKSYINRKEEYKKEIKKEERGFFIDEEGFYHHSLKEYCWSRAINDGITAYETKMGI